jgi:hypothetical protein
MVILSFLQTHQQIKEINYLKYPIYLGGNRGRGQLYPDGSKVITIFIIAQFLGQLQVLFEKINNNFYLNG